jgi:hypothetical protein
MLYVYAPGTPLPPCLGHHGAALFCVSGDGSDRMEELKETFGLRDEDLNLDLGPLGRLK